MESPFISIVIPVFNGSGTLHECLDSIRHLDYTRERLEVIVVDNGSTDSSVSIAKEYGAQVFFEREIKSSYAARNKGIIASKGDLIAFTDADCMVTPHWLKYITAHVADTTIGCFAGEIEAYKPKSFVEIFSDRWGFLRQQGTLSCPYLPYTQTANSVYRREVFEKAGLFRPEMTSGGDADIAWRMQKQLGLKIKFTPEALVYHKHRTSLWGLYKQFKKYEIGKKSWLKYYPDFPLPTAEQRFNEYKQAKVKVKKYLKENWKKYRDKKIDFVDFASPFIWVLINHATYSVRKKEMKTLT